MNPIAAMRMRASDAVRVEAIMTSFPGAAKLWLEPRDRTTLQQDSAGTTPVSAAGDPIGRIMDKSGAGNHATQTTSGNRPLWQTTYAAFNGSSHSWATPSIDFTGTSKVTVIAGVRKLTDANPGMLVEFSANVGANGGSFYIDAPENSFGNYYGFRIRTGSDATNRGYNDTSVSRAAPNTSVLTLLGDSQASTLASAVQARVNGNVITTAPTAGPTVFGNFGNYPLYVGRRAGTSFPFNGNLYGMLVIGRALSLDELRACERYMAQLAGIAI